MYLQLHSIYGIVEFKPKSLPTLQLLESIRDNFQRLEAMGPIEQTTRPIETLAFCKMCGNPISDYVIAEDVCPACLPTWTKAVRCLDGWRTLSPFEITAQLAPLYLYDATTGKSKALQASAPESEGRS